jgi:hypothetical protein
MTASVRWARSSLADRRPAVPLMVRTVVRSSWLNGSTASSRPAGERRQARTGTMTDMTKCRSDEPAKLLARQRALQTEAEDVRAQLGLAQMLGAVGDPVLVGSAALGLMAWRDIDVTVVCPSLDDGRVIAVAAELAAHQDVKSVEYRDDSGRWNLTTCASPFCVSRRCGAPGRSTAYRCVAGTSTRPYLTTVFATPTSSPGGSRESSRDPSVISCPGKRCGIEETDKTSLPRRGYRGARRLRAGGDKRHGQSGNLHNFRAARP